jgi:hypothetical protein
MNIFPRHPTGFGLRERLKSDHHEIEHAQSFESTIPCAQVARLLTILIITVVIHMHFLDERSINPPYIGPHDWFYRHTFDFRTKDFIVSLPEHLEFSKYALTNIYTSLDASRHVSVEICLTLKSHRQSLLCTFARGRCVASRTTRDAYRMLRV